MVDARQQRHLQRDGAQGGWAHDAQWVYEDMARFQAGGVGGRDAP